MAGNIPDLKVGGGSGSIHVIAPFADLSFTHHYGKIHLLFDVGPYYYFDTKDNHGFFPLISQFTIVFNLFNHN
ncbi:hypothetical protein ACJD0Z_18410 [Flavobacteriaceae bacterium M23B6Z8]